MTVEDIVFEVWPSGREIATDFIAWSDNELIVSKGYAWDGASGPAIDTKTIMRASLVHDVMYQLLRDELIPQSWRTYADTLMYRICREDGMSRIRAYYIYWVLRLFGGRYAKREHARPIKTAP